MVGKQGRDDSMNVRFLELKNNFFTKEPIREEEVNPDKPLGQFCVLGYFDAISQHELSEDNQIWDQRNIIQLKEHTPLISRRILQCMIPKDKRMSQFEKKFWETAEDDDSKPLYFITLIRMNCDPSTAIKKHYFLSDEIDSIAYYSYDHSSLTVVFRAYSYTEGIRRLHNIYANAGSYSIFKMYSIFSVLESALDKGVESLSQRLKLEYINCHLNCFVKDYIEADRCIKEMINFFREGSCDKTRKSHYEKGKLTVNVYDQLGSSDMLVEINHVALCEMLSFYKHKGIFTHLNSTFQNAFYNIETAFYEWKEAEVIV